MSGDTSDRWSNYLESLANSVAQQCSGVLLPLMTDECLCEPSKRVAKTRLLLSIHGCTLWVSVFYLA